MRDKSVREYWGYLAKREWLNDPKNWQESNRPLTPAETDFMAAVFRKDVMEHCIDH